jgi:hypothetical protein
VIFFIAELILKGLDDFDSRKQKNNLFSKMFSGAAQNKNKWQIFLVHSFYLAASMLS